MGAPPPRGCAGTVAVTGASGYLGSRFADRFAGAGWEVLRLVRSPRPDHPGDRRYDLAEEIGPDLLRSVDVLIHAAYDLTATRREEIWRVNVEGSRRLFEAAGRAGVGRIILISSMSAYEGTTQVYGRAKLAVESATLAAGGCAARVGLVYGEGAGGMAGTLRNLSRLPLLPLVGGRAGQYPVREADVIEAVMALATTADLRPEVLGVAGPDPVAFRTLLEAFGAEHGRRPRFVPVPWHPLYWLLRAVERSPLTLPFRADSLLGLVRPAPGVPGLDRLAELGVHPRAFAGATAAHAR